MTLAVQNTSVLCGSVFGFKAVSRQTDLRRPKSHGLTTISVQTNTMNLRIMPVIIDTSFHYL